METDNLANTKIDNYAFAGIDGENSIRENTKKGKEIFRSDGNVQCLCFS